MANSENPAWYAHQAQANAKIISAPNTNTLSPFNTWGGTQAYPNSITWTTAAPSIDGDMGAMVLNEARDGESWFVTMRRIVDEYREMKQALKELATLADCHGEDTVCL